MSHQSPFDDLQAAVEIAPIAPGASTATNGTGVDMQGWDGVLFILMKGLGNETTDLKAQSDTVSTFASAADITGASSTQIATGTTNIGTILDVWRPTKRYVRCVATT